VIATVVVGRKEKRLTGRDSPQAVVAIRRARVGGVGEGVGISILAVRDSHAPPPCDSQSAIPRRSSRRPPTCRHTSKKEQEPGQEERRGVAPTQTDSLLFSGTLPGHTHTMSSEQADMPSGGQTRPRRRPSASGDAGAAAATTTPAAAVAATANDADAAPPSRSHPHHHHRAPPSILDDLGEDLTGVATPVAVCMALTVALCRALNPDGASDAAAVRFASLAYEEKAGDTAAEKLGGGLLNALIFVAIMAGMTFGLFVLFKLKVRREGREEGAAAA